MMARRRLTEEQQAAADARRARFRELVRQVAGMGEAERAAFAQRLPGVVTVEGRVLSPVNSILCALQRTDVSMVGGFAQWRRAGRAVRQGERGLMIWIPKLKAGNGTGAPDGADGEDDEEAPRAVVAPKERAFCIGTVFDISQTVELGKTAGAHPA